MQRLALWMTLLMLLVAACGGGGDDDEPTATPAPTQQAAPPSAQVEADPGPPTSNPVSPQNLPFNLTPQGSGVPFSPPSGSAQNVAPPFTVSTPPFGAPGVAPGNGGPGGNTLQGAQSTPVPDETEEFVSFATDFSGLQPGGQALIMGTLSYRPVEGAAQPEAVLLDTQGNAVTLDFTGPMFGLYSEGESLRVTGVVAAPEQAGGNLVIQNVLVYQDIPENAGIPNFTQPNVVSPGQEGAPLFEDLSTADFLVTPNLPALQTYDAMVVAAQDRLNGLDWIAATGNVASGWQFQFINSETGEGEIYRVDPEGGVRVQGVAAGTMPQVFTVPLDRSRIVLDSDGLTQLVNVQYNVEEIGQLVFTLRAAEDGLPQWLVRGAPGEIAPIDATQPF
ncbi:MAG: hypothetical protein OHK0046_11420 [Anaerolineae bacterium]